MKFVDVYRDQSKAGQYLEYIANRITRPWTIMEICGGQTHAIVRFGIDQLLPSEVNLVHGPGCPVCVTPINMIDKAIEIALQRDVIFTSFGDMARVPGSEINLLTAKARGADLRLVYSPLDALKIAVANPDRQVVFFAVGFETTAPVTAATVHQARQLGIRNFSLLVSHVLVPPAMKAILGSPDCNIHGFLAAGHVCTVMGIEQYSQIARKFEVPIVVTGFEPLDILQGLEMCIRQLEEGRAGVENQYARAVHASGNQVAREIIAEVFQIVPRHWRGVGEIANSGLAMAAPYAEFDAELRFGKSHDVPEMETECISGEVLKGIAKPMDCPNFAIRCTPNQPLGAPMVSSEGACAAYFNHRKGMKFENVSTNNTCQYDP
ncbi:hydrogenase formation protein HypD [candidate division KSB1 bacterium]|nr:hydrogenase formation protein HypD [Phycisphaerae bacterium]NIP51080.1 hydrogenase formation protein HypD [Phycisphaerae bacterium]NIV92134.1 hydrogenase formation protein HypD [candidate division KSB1 bacterium]NIX31942.1 hydrogenase formation protein HypD [Phycisphaerae bacterium]